MNYSNFNYCFRILVALGLVVISLTTATTTSKTTDSCHAKNDWISQHHRCNITKYTYHQFQSIFGLLPPLYHEPIIIQTPPHRNQNIRQYTSQTGIVDYFPSNFTITLSSSNSFSEHRRTIPLVQYLQELQQDTTTTSSSNETWYFFGETHSPKWKELLYGHYELPPCETCGDADSVALSFGIGNVGSGVQWHIHGPGFAETLWGRKHWILYPRHQKPTFDPDQTSLFWMEYTYQQQQQPHDLPWECTLDPGEIIYFPDQWWHATINLDFYTSFISAFTTEHESFL